MDWLIDGYNVILSDERLARLLRIDNESGRNEFIREILGSYSFPRDRITVVFDGRFGPSTLREGQRVTVRFTPSGQSADDLIKAEIGKATRRRSLNVVTNDRSIINYARECGANITSSGDFLARIRNKVTNTGKRNPPSNEKPEATGYADRELLDLFTGKKG